MSKNKKNDPKNSMEVMKLVEEFNDQREPLDVIKGETPIEVYPSSYDLAYRRGYFHGYLKGMKTVQEFGYADTYEFLWNDIKEWRNADCSKVVQPPELTE